MDFPKTKKVESIHPTGHMLSIRDVKIDKSLPTEKRIKSYVEQIKNPYKFKVGDVIVKVSFSENENTISDNFVNMITNMYGIMLNQKIIENLLRWEFSFPTIFLT